VCLLNNIKFLQKLVVNKEYPAPVPYSYVMPLRKCKFFHKMVPCPNKYLEYIKVNFGEDAKNLRIVDCKNCTRDLTSDTLRMKQSIKYLHKRGIPTMYPLVEI
jgi:hypothetical protein